MSPSLLLSVLGLALLGARTPVPVEGHSIPRAWEQPDCAQDSGEELNDPEVKQLLHKTAFAFKKVGDMLLRKVQSDRAQKSAPQPVQYVHYMPQAPYGVYPAAAPFVYYPYPQVHALPAGYPGASTLGRKFVSLASEYEQVAANECSCGNVAVNMRDGPSPLAGGKSSDIVVEVTLGDLTRTPGAEHKGRDTCKHNAEVTERKEITNALYDSEISSKEEEVGADYYTKKSASASLEEKTVEDQEETRSIQVVEAIKLSPETSPLQIETFDNTAAVVEKTIEETVVVKKKTEEKKIVEEQGSETILTVKTYNGASGETNDEETLKADSKEYDYESETQNAEEYKEKVEVIEVKDESLKELKKEAAIGSEVYESEDVSKNSLQVAHTESEKTSQSTTHVERHTSEKEVKIKIVDVQSKETKSEYESESKTQVSKAQNHEEYQDSKASTDQDDQCKDGKGHDSMEKETSDLSEYFQKSAVHTDDKSTQASDEYEAGGKVSESCSLTEGEHVLSESPHPVKAVQIVVKGSTDNEDKSSYQISKKTEGQTHGQQPFRPQFMGKLHHHQHAPEPPVHHYHHHYPQQTIQKRPQEESPHRSSQYSPHHQLYEPETESTVYAPQQRVHTGRAQDSEEAPCVCHQHLVTPPEAKHVRYAQNIAYAVRPEEQVQPCTQSESSGAISSGEYPVYSPSKQPVKYGNAYQHPAHRRISGNERNGADYSFEVGNEMQRDHYGVETGYEEIESAPEAQYNAPKQTVRHGGPQYGHQIAQPASYMQSNAIQTQHIPDDQEEQQSYEKIRQYQGVSQPQPQYNVVQQYGRQATNVMSPMKRTQPSTQRYVQYSGPQYAVNKRSQNDQQKGFSYKNYVSAEEKDETPDSSYSFSGVEQPPAQTFVPAKRPYGVALTTEPLQRAARYPAYYFSHSDGLYAVPNLIRKKSELQEKQPDSSSDVPQRYNLALESEDEDKESDNASATEERIAESAPQWISRQSQYSEKERPGFPEDGGVIVSDNGDHSYRYVPTGKSSWGSQSFAAAEVPATKFTNDGSSSFEGYSIQ